MRSLNSTTREILAQNSGRDFDRLVLKFAALRQDPFAFFRGTNGLFLKLLPRRHELFRAPVGLICGDLHLENFGAFKGDNRLVYFDMNDFDEACLGPITLDLVRFMASVHIAAPGLGLSRARARKLCKEFLEAYVHSVRDGKPRWIERSLAQGVFRALLRRAMRRTRRELLNRLTRLKGKLRHIRIGKRALELSSPVSPKLKKLLASICTPGIEGKRFFGLLDAARRVAGNGSLGLPRFVLLVRGRGGADGNFALDLKFAAPSAPAEWLSLPQPEWRNEAERVVTLQRLMQAIAPALLQPVRFEQRAWVLKELQPAIDRLALAEWRDRPKRIAQAVVGMGHVTAWAQLRGSGHFGAANAESLQDYVDRGRWRHAALKIAEAGARRIEESWRAYSRDYDSGAVTAALKTAAKKSSRDSVSF